MHFVLLLFVLLITAPFILYALPVIIYVVPFILVGLALSFLPISSGIAGRQQGIDRRPAHVTAIAAPVATSRGSCGPRHWRISGRLRHDPVVHFDLSEEDCKDAIGANHMMEVTKQLHSG